MCNKLKHTMPTNFGDVTYYKTNFNNNAFSSKFSINIIYDNN